jgi:hypothetical protein
MAHKILNSIYNLNLRRTRYAPNTRDYTYQVLIDSHNNIDCGINLCAQKCLMESGGKWREAQIGCETGRVGAGFDLKRPTR